MADNNPGIPGGAVPPKPAEASKIQPKKETVRINLPPKPSAAPTIKLPTLPPGGPSAVGAPQFAAAPAPPALGAGIPHRTAAAPASSAAPAAAPRTSAAPRAAAPPRAAVSGLDKALAIVAAVAAAAAVGTTIWMTQLFTSQ